MKTLRTNALTTLKSLTRQRSLKVAVMLLAALLTLPLPAPAAPADDSASYTYIITGRHYFGDDYDKSHAYTGEVYKGLSAQYVFNLPGVNRAQPATLMLKFRDVGSYLHVFTLNGYHLDALRGSDDSFEDRINLQPNYVLVPGYMLKETGNVLRIAARNKDGGLTDVDDFVVGEVVLIYKTVPSSLLVR
jgi:hypothetical protein